MRAGVLLRRRRDLPDRAVRVAQDAAVAPEALGGELERCRPTGEGGAEEAVHDARLCHHQRHRVPAEPGRGPLRGAYPHSGVQAAGRGVEGVGGGRVRHFEGDVVDGVHGCVLSRDGLLSVTAGVRSRRYRSWISPRTLPSGSVTVATQRPPPTSRTGSFTVAPAAVTSASFASMSGTCQ